MRTSVDVSRISVVKVQQNLRLPTRAVMSGLAWLGVPVEASRAQTAMIAVVSMSELLPIVFQVMLSTLRRSAVAGHPSNGELH